MAEEEKRVMKKQNKKTLPIVTLVLAGLAFLMLVLSPLYLGANKYLASPLDVMVALNMRLGPALGGIFLFQSGAVYGIISFVMLIALLVIWIIHLLAMVKAHRKDAILPNVAWIIGAGIAFVIVLGCVSNKFLFDGKIATGNYANYAYADIFAYVGYAGGVGILALIPFILALAAYVVGVVMITKDLAACLEAKAVKAAAVKEEAERKEAAKADQTKQVEPKQTQQDELDTDENELITSDELRQIIREEMRADANKASNGLTQEEVRTIIAQELDKRSVQQQPAPVKAEAPKEEPKKEEAKPQPIVVNVPTPAVQPETKAEKPAVVVPPAPVESAPVVEEKKAAPRIPFPARLDVADKDVKNNYNEIKAEAISFGLKSRLSNSGDTFRLHTKTYLKITVAGKGLKIYFAIDPKTYADSPIPLKDVSKKNLYKEIPSCFKVKSDLSVKRAKQLIADACSKDKIEQGKIEPKNYAAQMKFFKAEPGDVPADAAADDKD